MDEFAKNTPETRVDTGKTPAKAREAASSVPDDADAINAKQIEEAKAAGGEYQGKLATEKAPASGRQEQG